ncbi:MAG: sugar phosphate isomerase/epimerase [Clostridia bacterium]|nr:sugar phosphate isomerase/epimerase [Clostridia bacterium]
MKLVTTTANFIPYYDDRSIAAPLKSIPHTGFRYVDICFDGIIYPGSPWLQPGDLWKKEVEDCLTARDKYGISFVQSHAPDGEHFVPGEKRDAFFFTLPRVFEACLMLGIPHTVVHSQPYDSAPERFYPENIAFYRHFADFAEKYEVDMLTENSSTLWLPNHKMLTGADLVNFIREADIPRLHICWDTGHANCEGRDQYSDIMAMGKELRAFHMQDNFGSADLHMTPLMGTVNFDRVMQGIVDAGYSGNFTFEDCCSLRSAEAWPLCRKNLLPTDKLRQPTLDLVEKMTAVSRSVGGFILTSYGFPAE